MKETKVYVDEMPNSCSKCEYCTLNHKDNYGRPFCLIARMPLYNGDKVKEERGQYKDSLSDFNCPLIDIKTHDEEKDKKIKQLEDKIRELQEVDNKRAFRLYAVLYDVLKKQDPENVASRIDFMTSENYADICELYKTAKNLKQHDREVVKEVCDEIKNKLGSIEDILINLGNGKEDALNYFMYILNKTQKEYEK